MKKLFVVLCCVFMMIPLIACSNVKRESSLNTNLEFWITENVTDFDFSDYTMTSSATSSGGFPLRTMLTV